MLKFVVGPWAESRYLGERGGPRPVPLRLRCKNPSENDVHRGLGWGTQGPPRRRRR